MQDHVIGGVMMTVRGAFFEKTDYHNLVINSIERFFGGKRIKFLPPAIFKPKQLWTGKQVLSTIILNMCGGTGPSYIGGMRTQKHTFKAENVDNGANLQ
jgi:DNA-directed RNA polymerase beta' subunit